MTRPAGKALDDLRAVLAPIGRAAVAVSGGVDSVTLAVVAHRTAGTRIEAFHAVSPAVPPEATARVRRYAAAEGWSLRIIDAGEFDDADYRANPANRCFYCKTNLYDSVAAGTERTILSGTNLDDLGDWRPGLEAAKRRGVRHPFVEAGIDKETVRAIARHLRLDDLAELPAAPCLSSRIETGLRIEADQLTLVHAVERYLARQLAPETVRCRVRRDSIVVELDPSTLASLATPRRDDLGATITRMFREAGIDRPVAFSAYRMGSAFLRDSAHG